MPSMTAFGDVLIRPLEGIRRFEFSSTILVDVSKKFEVAEALTQIGLYLL